MTLLRIAPETNGIMEDLTEEQILVIKAELELIIEEFEPDAYTATVTTHYIVSKYNEVNKGKEINGDTASYILAYTPEEPQA